MVPTRRREFGRLADLPMQGSQYTVEACIMLDPSTPPFPIQGPPIIPGYQLELVKTIGELEDKVAMRKAGGRL